jgi:RNA polymerase sigma factor (sigma-70 family)
VGLTVEKIFASYHGLLMKFIRERVNDQADAEDVAQEVYYRIARKPDLEQISYPKAFLIRTAQNLMIDMSRCGRNVEIHPDTDLDLEVDTSEETPGNYALGADVLRTLEDALAELSPKCQAVFVMNRIDGISIRQIAVDINLSKSMVEKYMRQALKHLKNKMEKHYDNG